jgi:hypothetical protein
MGAIATDASDKERRLLGAGAATVTSTQKALIWVL